MNIKLENYAGITADSRKVKNNFIYVAISGNSVDGHDFIPNAIENGASLIVAERDCGVEFSHIVADSRIALNELLRDFYDNPAQGIKLFGVTGTNGKTTTATLVNDFLQRENIASALISTVEFITPKRRYEATHTTPDPEGFFQILDECRHENVEVLSMELSSHALDQGRVNGVKFKCALFTNLTGDHLDYHKNMDNYFQAKRRLFDELLAQDGTAIINIDDEYGRRLLSGLKFVKSFGCSTDASCRIFDIILSDSKSEFSIYYQDNSYRILTTMIGLHNIYNLVGAMLSAQELGVSWSNLVEYAKTPCAVAGRLERYTLPNNVPVMIDYAHTADALSQVLQALRPLTQGRLIALFGCGGDRDRTKRPKMGNVVATQADVGILTSDNPRSEDPQEIINEVLSGITAQNSNIFVEIDRAKAIKLACSLAKTGDVILIAGKGHEKTQEINGQKFHFSDAEEVKKYQ